MVMRPKIVTIFCVALTLALYLPTVHRSYFSDDRIYVVNNPQIKGPVTDAWKDFLARTNPYEYLPLRDLSYRIDYLVAGLDARWYHIHNLILYALCCWAIWAATTSLLLLCRRLQRPEERIKDEWIAAAVTILFALHPAHVESVAWISGRKELLSGLFVFISMWQFTKAISQDSPDWKRLLIGAIFYAFALLSKAAVLPLALVTIVISILRYGGGRENLGLIFKLNALFLMVAVAGFFLNLKVGASTAILITDPLQRASSSSIFDVANHALLILGYLARIALVPFNMRLIYDVLEPGFPYFTGYVLGIASVILFFYSWWMLWYRRSIASFGIIFFLSFCLPYLQIIPYKTWSLASERFLFVSIFGISFLAIWFVSHWKQKYISLLIPVVSLIFIVLTAIRALQWGDPKVLITQAVEKAPAAYESQTVYINDILIPRRDFDAAYESVSKVRDPFVRAVLQHYIAACRANDAHRWEDAEREAAWLKNAIGTDGRPEMLRLIGTIHEKRGRILEAARHYYYEIKNGYHSYDTGSQQNPLARVQAAFRDDLNRLTAEVESNPGNVYAIGHLANLKMELYMLTDAEHLYRRILTIQPGNIGAHYNLGLTLARQGRHREAAGEIEVAIQGGLRNADAWNNLGLAHKNGREFEKAENAYKESLRADSRAWYGGFNLARLYWGWGKKKEAVTSLQETKQRLLDANLPTDMVDLYIQRFNEK
jgi:tetratricopeptide (TPR) repeat protein